MWLSETPATMMYTLFTYSCKMISAYQLWFRQIVIDVIDPEQQVVGGPGVKVQINVSKLAKRKYDQGHSVGDGLWVFGGIDANNNWFTVVMVIKESTLLLIIHRYIAPEYHINYDFWKSYSNLGKHGGGRNC